MIVNPITYQSGLPPKRSSLAAPVPAELPAWNEVTTRNDPIPTIIATTPLNRCATVPRILRSVDRPIRTPMLTKHSIRMVAITGTHNSSYPNDAPMPLAVAIEPGPNTSAAVTKAGPIDPNRPFLRTPAVDPLVASELDMALSLFYVTVAAQSLCYADRITNYGFRRIPGGHTFTTRCSIEQFRCEFHIPNRNVRVREVEM